MKLRTTRAHYNAFEVKGEISHIILFSLKWSDFFFNAFCFSQEGLHDCWLMGAITGSWHLIARTVSWTQCTNLPFPNHHFHLFTEHPHSSNQFSELRWGLKMHQHLSPRWTWNKNKSNCIFRSYSAVMPRVKLSGQSSCNTDPPLCQAKNWII